MTSQRVGSPCPPLKFELVAWSSLAHCSTCCSAVILRLSRSPAVCFRTAVAAGASISPRATRLHASISTSTLVPCLSLNSTSAARITAAFWSAVAAPLVCSKFSSATESASSWLAT